MQTNAGVLILAGGKSERMIFPKPYLLYNGRTFLENISEGYFHAGLSNICLVIRDEYCQGKWSYSFQEVSPFISILERITSDQGRFYSLKTGLKHFTDIDFCFVHNVDNPFIDSRTIQLLWQNRNAEGYTKAVYRQEGGHPLLLSQKIIKKINTLDNSDYNLKDILKKFPGMDVEVDSSNVLLNINTPEEYERHIHSLKQ